MQRLKIETINVRDGTAPTWRFRAKDRGAPGDLSAYTVRLSVFDAAGQLKFSRTGVPVAGQPDAVDVALATADTALGPLRSFYCEVDLIAGGVPVKGYYGTFTVEGR